jgi:lipoprotein-anchoring transpeptidase ErfK/SrfK
LPDQVIEAVTVLGTPRVYLVEEGPIDGWVRLHLPVRPNGSSGWVLARDVELNVVNQRLVVDISERSLKVFEEGAEILTTPVAVGSNTNPTPVGLFFVTDALETGNPRGAWGPFAFGLSAHSDSITEFNGGDGIIGIHGTSKPNSIGKAVSLGCVRVPNQVMLELAELVQLGVPVLIEE